MPPLTLDDALAARLLPLVALATTIVALGALWIIEHRRRRRADVRARVERDRVAEITAGARESISLYGADRRLDFQNAAFEHLTGFSPDEIRIQPLLDYVHPDDRDPVLAAWDGFASDPAPYAVEYRVITRLGHPRWCAAVWRPVRDAAGAVTGYLGAELDVTDRRQAEERLRRDAELFQTIVEVQQAIAAVGLDSDAVTHVIVERSQTLTAADGASIERIEGNELVTRASVGIAAPRLFLHNSLSGLCVRTGELQRSDDAASDRRVDRELGMRLGIRSMLVVPLMHEQQVIGVLKVVATAPRAFTEQDERALRLLAGLMGASLSHAATFEARQARLEERTAALQESEQRFKQLVDVAQEGICVLDDRGVTTYINQRMTELVGHASGDILGRPLFDFMDAASRGEAQRRLSQPQHSAERHELRFRRRDGSDLWTIVATSPILGRNGSFVGTVALVTDITERKLAEERLRRSAERLRTLHDIDQAILSARSPAEVANAALARLRRLVPCQRYSIVLFDFGGHEAQLVAGVSGSQPIAPGPVPLAHLSAVETLRRGVIRYVEDIATVQPRPAVYDALLGEGVRSLLSVPLLADGETIGELNLGTTTPGGFEPEHREIAVEVAVPLAVAIQHARLRDELARRTGELERRIAERSAELRRVDAEFDAFARAVAQDLRAPIRHLQGFSQLLIEEAAARSSDETSRHYAERVREAARTLGTLLDGLLTVVRVGRQDLMRRPTDLNVVLDDARLQLQPELDRRGIDWHAEPLPSVDCDPALVRTVLVELLENAVKFSATRTRPCVRISPIVVDGHAGVAIQDSGIGFKMAHATRIFDIFQRLHRADEFDGAGIGLAVVQRIVQRHGGRVWYEAEPEAGATFYFTLGAPPLEAIP